MEFDVLRRKGKGERRNYYNMDMIHVPIPNSLLIINGIGFLVKHSLGLTGSIIIL